MTGELAAMEENPTKPAMQDLRWKRALIAAVMAEFLLILTANAVRAYTPSRLVDFIVIAIAGLIAFIAAGYWTASRAKTFQLLNGVLPAVFGTIFYVAFVFAVSRSFGFDFVAMVSRFYFADYLPILIGGAIGGFLAERKAA
jgi:hypothetical protein